MAGKDSQKGWDSGAVWMKEKIIARGVCVWGGEGCLAKKRKRFDKGSVWALWIRP